MENRSVNYHILIAILFTCLIISACVDNNLNEFIFSDISEQVLNASCYQSFPDRWESLECASNNFFASFA